MNKVETFSGALEALCQMNHSLCFVWTSFKPFSPSSWSRNIPEPFSAFSLCNLLAPSSSSSSACRPTVTKHKQTVVLTFAWRSERVPLSAVRSRLSARWTLGGWRGADEYVCLWGGVQRTPRRPVRKSSSLAVTETDMAARRRRVAFSLSVVISTGSSSRFPLLWRLRKLVVSHFSVEVRAGANAGVWIQLLNRDGENFPDAEGRRKETRRRRAFSRPLSAVSACVGAWVQWAICTMKNRNCDTNIRVLSEGISVCRGRKVFTASLYSFLHCSPTRPDDFWSLTGAKT